jgi:ATP-dependent RNA circularization protein (DNA/RNA ligase family)
MGRLELKAFVEQNPDLVTMRESERYPGLFVLKYKRRVFFDSLWNEYLEECRGTVIDRDFNVIVRPFTKIYNYGIEDRSPVFKPNDVVMAYDKVNGFMASVTTYKDELLVSTTGSLDSDFAKMAERMILDTADVFVIKHFCQNGKVTLLFEVVDPSDPHIIPEQAGLYYLGYRINDWYSDMRHMAYETIACDLIRKARWMKVNPVPSYMVTTVAELEKSMLTSRREGVVFYHMDGRAAKIKTKYYLAQKFVARNPRTDKLLTQAAYEILDEEYYPLLNEIRAKIDEFTALDEQARLVWCRNYLETI